MEKTKHFQLSNNIYGRKNEIEILNNAFNHICNGDFKLVMVKGNSGTGKTKLITSTFEPFISGNIFFITGKFDQFNRDEPYVPFIQAFKDLVRRILTEPKDVIEEQKKKLLKVLGKNGAVIAGLIPEIEFIIGKQPSLVELDPQKNQMRFERVFKKFVQVFAVKQHPMILFIDDLQWADRASLQLFRSLCNIQESSYILIIGAYRDEEVDDGHLLKSTIKGIEDDGVKVEYISLENLSLEHTAEVVADSLQDTEKKSAYLAEVVYRKTLGNPFFIKQMLQLYYDEKRMHCNEQKICWEWYADHIRSKKIPADIVEVVINKLKMLPDETMDVLKLAAGLGNSFDLDTLSIVFKTSHKCTIQALMPAVSGGFVLPENKELLQKKDSINMINGNCRFEFLHDRVQQAVCALLDDDERKRLHLRIGRLLLENTSVDDLDKIILGIMAQFNYALEMITDPKERVRFSEYNLTAGKKAKASTAWHAARKYFKAGVALLPQNSWDEYYKLTYELYIELSQSQYLTNNLEEAGQLFEEILAHAKDSLEIAQVYYLKTILFSSSGNYPDAIKSGIEGLKHLDINLPENPRKLHMMIEIILSKWYYRGKKIRNLTRKIEERSPRIQKVQELITVMGGPTSNANKKLYALIVLKIANLSGKYGITPYSAFGYAVYSFFAGSYLGDYKKGYELKNAAIELIQKYPDNNPSAHLVYFFAGAFISHWTQHAQKSLEYLEKAYDKSMESGDLLYAVYAVMTTLRTKYALGVNLKEISQYCTQLAGAMKEVPIGLRLKAVYEQMVGTLEGTIDPLVSQNVFEKLIPESTTNEVMTCYLFQVQLDYLLGNYKNALQISHKAQNDIDSIRGYLFYPEHIFYYSLSITAAFHQLSGRERKLYGKILKKNLKKLKKWSDNCADNFLHKYLLILAEKSRINGREKEAMDLYDRAIKSASENGYIQNEAIACELAGKFYNSLGRDKIASVYINDAYTKYKLWGAEAKANALKQQYPHMIIHHEAKDKTNIINTKETEKQLSDMVNSDRILQAFKTLAQQTDMKKVLEIFLQIVMEISGADKGYILLEKDEELYIEAYKESYELPVKTVNIILGAWNNIPQKLVRYAARTYEAVILNDSQPAGIFSTDLYIIQNRPASAACMPIMVQDIFTGVLYLEKNMASGRFTQESIEGIRALSSQVVLLKKLQYFMEKEAEENRTGKSLQMIEQLTAREMETLRHIASGKSNKEIGESLGLTVNTVKTHIVGIYGKLGVRRRAQAVIKAREMDL